MQISQKITDYAIWYYLKYYPSVAKLKQKLKEKFGPKSPNGKKYAHLTDDEIDFIISEKLQNIIQETEVVKAKIKYLNEKGKSRLYIKQKLYERQEPKELIEQFLEEEFLE
jgi:SOS response regulatory protein OraA/RecX